MGAPKAKPSKVNHFKPPVIKKCVCQNEQQDALHGKNYRVMNHAPKKGAERDRYRCTVCLREHRF